MTTIQANSTVAVYQTWEADRFVADDLRRAARASDIPMLKRLVGKLQRDAACYCGTVNLVADMHLEDIYLLLQNDSHRDGWVKATGAQDGWLESTGGAPSLSMGDVLEIVTRDADGRITRDARFVVGMVGFVEVS